MYISLSLPLKEEFSLHQKLGDSLDYREQVDMSDTNCFTNPTILRNPVKIKRELGLYFTTPALIIIIIRGFNNSTKRLAC